MNSSVREIDFEDEGDELDVAEKLSRDETAAVVTGTDWTTETIVEQLKKGNIQLNPHFQRRDAWKRDRKSRFIESLVLGLPIPQIVLAESKLERGRFMVLDGKQRLLSVLQFWGLAEGENNGFGLSGLTLRPDLKKKTIEDLRGDSSLDSDFNALSNQPIRTVVIRNWKDTDFLHTVFLRLNTGSVNLSPQELRQALLPGKFSTFVDKTAADSPALKKLLGLEDPDPRMRDIEILARFIAFNFFANVYPGRMKRFLDDSFAKLNNNWRAYESKVKAACAEFEAGVGALVTVFGDGLARKPGSAQFNRAIFDALIYFHSQKAVRQNLKGKSVALRRAYKALFVEGSEFASSVESDTAGAPNTAARMRIWGNAISKIAGKKFAVPKIPVANRSSRKSK